MEAQRELVRDAAAVAHLAVFALEDVVAGVGVAGEDEAAGRAQGGFEIAADRAERIDAPRGEVVDVRDLERRDRAALLRDLGGVVLREDRVGEQGVHEALLRGQRFGAGVVALAAAGIGLVRRDVVDAAGRRRRKGGEGGQGRETNDERRAFHGRVPFYCSIEAAFWSSSAVVGVSTGFAGATASRPSEGALPPTVCGMPSIFAWLCARYCA